MCFGYEEEERGRELGKGGFGYWERIPIVLLSRLLTWSAQRFALVAHSFRLLVGAFGGTSCRRGRVGDKEVFVDGMDGRRKEVRGI